MSDSNTNEPAAPKPNLPPPRSLNDVIYDAVRDFWMQAGKKPTALYLGVFEHRELRELAEKVANFTITDPPGRLPKSNALFEYNGMRVFKVDVLSHVGVGR